MFLTAGELAELTGYKRNADQRRWLSDRGWLFEVAATGRPVVARTYTESRIGALQQGKPVWTPNLAAFKV